MTRVKRLLLGCLCTVALFAASPSDARADLPGSTLYAWGSQVWVKFVGFSAAYTNDLYYFASWGGPAQYVFTNKTATPGQQYLVGNSLVTNQELIFGIYVHEANRWYFSGDPARNADNTVHASLTDLPAGNATRVGFEDLWNGGDLDYNDLEFDVMNAQSTVTPEPVSMVLLASGLIGVGGAAARRRRKQG
jgi:hypothetical protein